jgi:HlyD family secretion protein
MSVLGKRWLLWGAVGALIAAGLVLAFRPRALGVELRTLEPAPFRVVLEAEGMTRVRDVFTVSAPVAGHVLRNPLEVGDELVQGRSVVATIEPSDPAFLDPRAQAESQHELEAAQAEHDLAKAEVARAEADRSFAETELARAEELFARGSVPQRFVDEARRAFRSADAALGAARAALDVREHQVMRARARLYTPVQASPGSGGCNCIELTAPADGRVLRIFEKSEAVVAAGTPLVEIGDPADLEVVADYLSADAVRIAAGQRAEITGWGGDTVLEARVRRVEPFGFTKISALGVEEQRVNVVLDLVAPRERWGGLGHGYRVIVRVIGWESDAALTVPVTALFRNAGTWHVFVDEDGVARLRTVEAGQRSGLEVLVTSGLEAGEQVVVNPPEALADGMRIEALGGQ